MKLGSVMRKLRDLIVNYSSINDDLNDVYLIAEAGVNHEGSIDQALRLVDAAAEGGADAIKFQTYKAKSLASKNSPAYWDLKQESTRSQYELFKKYDCFLNSHSKFFCKTWSRHFVFGVLTS